MWYRNPYVHLALNALLVAASQLLLKRGATETAGAAPPHGLGWTGITALASPWSIAGIACFIVSLFNWLQALRKIPLSIAFPVTSGSHVLVPLGAWAFLGEVLSPMRWLGIALVLVGILFCARPRGERP